MTAYDAFWDNLKELPPDPVVHWGGIRLTSESSQPRYAVYSPELCQPSLDRWAWLLVGSESLAGGVARAGSMWTEDEPRASKVLLVEPDYDLWVVHESESVHEAEMLLSASVRSLTTWSSSLVSRTLALWAQTVLKRDDLHFEMTSGAVPPEAEGRLPSAGASEEALYLVSDSVAVTERVLDELLALPHERAAVLTREIAHIASENGYGELHWSD